MNTRVTAYVGLGANLGEARLAIERAFLALEKLPESRLIARSNVFSSAPIEAQGPDFINAVAQLDTGLSAEALLDQLQKLESDAGRDRPYKNAPRTLDLDILLFGDLRCQTARLSVPHPRLTQRAFALIPLLQIDPFIHIPGLGAAHQFTPGVSGQKIHKLP